MVEKITKVIYKAELTEETYVNIVKVLQDKGMKKELAELGVEYAKAPSEQTKRGWSFEEEINNRNKIQRDMLNILNNVPTEQMLAEMIAKEKAEEEANKEIEYSNPFNLDGFKFVYGRSRKGKEYGPVSIIQEEENKQINLNHYNAIRLVTVLESILNEVPGARTNIICRFSLDNEGNPLAMTNDNKKIVTVILNVYDRNRIHIFKENVEIVLNPIQARFLVDFIKEYKEMN